ncbi:MAG TPA: S49 family peptidase [Paludibacter sp.]|nr:S49 family peptidase [Paludibacter sp.]
MDKTIQILTSPMGCEPNARHSILVSALTAIKNGTTEAFEKHISESGVIMKAYSKAEEGPDVNTCDQWDLEDNSLPSNSVAVIWVEGILYPWKTFRLEQNIAAANANNRIVGILVVYNTPGGMIHRVDITSEAIAKSMKPVVGYVTGMCASAGMWLASGSKRIFCASKTDFVGSIGIMTTFQDETKWFESMGIVVKDIYATDSTLKNEETRAAAEGDFTPLITELDFVNELFHTQVAANLGIKVDKESPVFQGATFFAEEAIALGLAHEIGTLNKALNYTLAEGMKVQANNNF